MNLPVLGISTGDPAGIGPEITARAMADESVFKKCRPLVVGDAWIMEQIIGICRLPLTINKVSKPAEAQFNPGCMDVLDMKNIDPDSFRFNEVSAMCGKASYEYVAKMIELAMAGEIDGTVTGPISKEAIQKAGFNYAGHTEIYGKLTGTKDYCMMLADGNFRVTHVSTHVSLLEAIYRVKTDRVAKVIHLSETALRQMGIKSPKIAVAGLNPHAGENGLFGREELDEIIPAIEKCRKEGMDVTGPEPPDTIFPKMKGGQYDLVVCMYHDQGHIPTKLLAFDYDHTTGKWKGLSGVNITLGLPVIRVSVDHGVAFDKGGRGEANPQSMINAIHTAAAMTKAKI